jgi:hypothetical protein
MALLYLCLCCVCLSTRSRDAHYSCKNTCIQTRIYTSSTYYRGERRTAISNILFCCTLPYVFLVPLPRPSSLPPSLPPHTKSSSSTPTFSHEPGLSPLSHEPISPQKGANQVAGRGVEAVTRNCGAVTRRAHRDLIHLTLCRGGGGGGGGGGDFSMLNIRMSRTPIEGSDKISETTA